MMRHSFIRLLIGISMAMALKDNCSYLRVKGMGSFQERQDRNGERFFNQRPCMWYDA